MALTEDLKKTSDGKIACGGHPEVAAVKVLAYGGGYGGLPGRLVPVCEPCLKAAREYFKEPGC